MFRPAWMIFVAATLVAGGLFTIFMVRYMYDREMARQDSAKEVSVSN
jgi:hypothetical protein